MTGKEAAKRAPAESIGWAPLQHLNELIRFADVKAGAALAAAGLLAGQLWANRSFLHDGAASWSKAFMVIATCGASVSVLLSLYALAPRRERTDPDSLHFDLVFRRYSHDRKAFVENWLEITADNEATKRMIAAQIWAANLVAHRKFIVMTWSIRSLVAGFAAWMVALLA